LGGQKPKTPEPIDKNFGMGDYVGDDFPQAKNQTPHWGLGGVCVKYHPRVVFSTRCNIYISRLCYDASVRLSVTEVHWRIIANLGFKFRSHFTTHCGRHAAGGRRAACGRIISRHASQC